MAFLEEIKKYSVSYFGGGKNINEYQYRAMIGLRRDDNSLIGTAYFHRSPDTMPDTDDQNTSGYVYCHSLGNIFRKSLIFSEMNNLFIYTI